MWWWWAGCDRGDFVIGPAIDSGAFGDREPTSATPITAVVRVSTPDARAPLARRLDIVADRPVSVTFSWGDRRVEVSERTATHGVLLVGFAEGTVTLVSVTLQDDAGELALVVPVDSPPAPAHFPVATIGVPSASRIGDTLVPLRVTEGDPPSPRDVAAVYDARGRLVYWLDVGDTLMDVRAVDDGLVAVVGIHDARLVHFRWDGLVLDSWTLPPGDSGTVVATSWEGRLHHDGGHVPDGSGRLLALARTPLEVADYPASYDDPLATERRTIADDVVLLFGQDGVVEREVRLSAVLPTSRIGYGSLDDTSEGWADWAHANAVEWQPDGSTLVSLRHQDLVLSLEASGAVRWLMGHDANLGPELQGLRLRPVGETTFPWHQHGVHLGGERADGTRLLTMFDNGNDRAAPFTGVPRVTTPASLRSRVVGYAVDEVERTIGEEWSFTHPAGPLYSEAVGDADQLPDGHVLSVWGYLTHTPEGIANTDAGHGRRSVRVVEFQPGLGAAATVTWELVLESRLEDNRWGWAGARAQRFDLPGSHAAR